MVMPLSTELRTAMFGQGQHEAAWVVDVSRDGTPTLEDVQIAKTGTIEFRRSTRIQATGRMFVASTQKNSQGRTLAPRFHSDIFAPFGQEIEIRRVISNGGSPLGSVPMGRFRIQSIPSPQETRRRLGGRRVPDAVAMEVTFADRFEAMSAARFTTQESPPRGATVWGEIRRLALFPIVVNAAIPDTAVPLSVVYNNDRLGVMTMLADHVDAELVMNRLGQLTMRPRTPSLDLPYDITGTIADMVVGMSNEVANTIVLSGGVGARSQFRGIAQDVSSDLSIFSPVGVRVREVSDPLAVTQNAANESAKAWLRRELRRNAQRVTVTCLPHPELDLGDVVRATDPESDRVVVGTVDAMTFSLDPTALMTLQILVEIGQLL